MAFDSKDTAAFKGVWVFCEQREGVIMSTSYQLLSEGRKLADELGSKLYGILLGRTEDAERVFDDAVQRIAPLLEQPSTGKRCAFFSITSSGLATVRKSGDYVAQMIGMAGGEYVFTALTDSGNSLSTMNIPLEDLYAGVKDADVLIYNGTIEGTISTKEELLARCALLAECKAVQSGDIWCTTPSFFQQSMALADFMLDLHAVFTGETASPDTLHFLTKIT